MSDVQATEAGQAGAPGTGTPAGGRPATAGVQTGAGAASRDLGGATDVDSKVSGAQSRADSSVAQGEGQIRSNTDAQAAGTRATAPVTDTMTSGEGTLRGHERSVSGFDQSSEYQEGRATLDAPRRGVESGAAAGETDYREARATIDTPPSQVESARSAGESDYREARATIDTPQREADSLRARPREEFDSRTGGAVDKAQTARSVASDPSTAAADRARQEAEDKTAAGRGKLDDIVDELDPTKKV